MHHHYDDILSRISDPPLWWDEHAVPRFDPFSPRETANIYADSVVLFLITCQGCGREFKVCMSEHENIARGIAAERGRPYETLVDQIKTRSLHYGDPPNVGCCAAGATMNSEPRRVLECWRRQGALGMTWKRDSSLEVDITPDWVQEGA